MEGASSPALRELRAYPFLAPDGDRGAQPAGASADAIEVQALAAALCQAHARVRTIERLLAGTLAALHDPAATGGVPAGVPLLLRDTGRQLIALGVEFKIGE